VRAVDLRAGELLRVCRPGGRIGMVNWVPRRLCRVAVPDHRPLPPEVARSFDVSDDDTLVLRQDYLEAVIRKPATS
jgi:hypothetical protein